MRYSLKWPQYKEQWDSMKILPSWQTKFEFYANSAMNHSRQYMVIEQFTSVPWAMIACIHRRESDSNFNTYLGNGDPLSYRTTHVPRGRGPFKTFEDGAIDALKLDGLSDVKDWRLEKILFYMEKFNGGGYDAHHLPSPYLWAGTSIQRPGKFTSDGHWDPHAIDRQLGCAPLLKCIMKLDQSIEYQRED